jgi:peptide/nickel transport system permease protein
MSATPALVKPSLLRTRLASVGWIARQHPLPSLGFLVMLVFVAVSALPMLFATDDPLEQHVESALAPPGSDHFFGTDQLGRDVYSRVVYGLRLTLLSGFSVVVIATILGGVLGLIAGARGGFLDSLIMRLSDIFLSFPSLIMAIAIVAFLGPSLVNAMIAISLIWWPQYARLVRGQVLAVRELPYIEAARSVGATKSRILFRYILPNTIVPVLVKASIDFSHAILITSSLSFLGVGAQPPSPELGAMVTEGRVFLLTSWWYSTFPSLAIFSAVLALNLLSDGIRDLLDPTIQVQ